MPRERTVVNIGRPGRGGERSVESREIGAQTLVAAARPVRQALLSARRPRERVPEADFPPRRQPGHPFVASALEEHDHA